MPSELDVITIHYNNLAGLKKTIESILIQEVKPNAVYVVDGGSSDGSVEWLASASLPPWIKVTSEEDAGIYDAMNKGLGKGSSNLIVMMNSGDRFCDSSIVGFILESHNQRGWDWAYGDSLMVDSRGSALGLHALRHLAKLRFFGGFATAPHQATVYSRELIEEVGIFRTDIGTSADQEHVMRCWRHSEPYYLARTVAECDATGVGSTRRVGALALDMRRYRRLNGVERPGSFVLWPLVTMTAMAFDMLRAGLLAFRRADLWRKTVRSEG